MNFLSSQRRNRRYVTPLTMRSCFHSVRQWIKGAPWFGPECPAKDEMTSSKGVWIDPIH